MIDFDKMTVAEHEQYKEMQRKAEAWDDMRRRIDYRQSDRAFDIGVVAMNVMEEYDNNEQVVEVMRK